MLHVLVTHQVQDYTAWKTAFDNFAEFRKSSGEKSFHIFQAPDDSNNLTLIFKWDNQENAEKFLTSSELRTTMQSAGVLEQPKIQYLNEVDQGSL